MANPQRALCGAPEGDGRHLPRGRWREVTCHGCLMRYARVAVSAASAATSLAYAVSERAHRTAQEQLAELQSSVDYLRAEVRL